MSQSTGNAPETSAAVGKKSFDPLEALRPIVDRAVEFAKKWDQQYQSHIFEVAIALLMRELESQPLPLVRDVAGVSGQIAGRSAEDRELTNSIPGKVGRALGMDATAIERIVHSDADGKVEIVGRLEGKSRRELQINYSLVYCFIKEIGLGQRDVDIEELRSLCIEQGCYDAPNFTANFRKAATDGLLLEIGGKVGRSRRFRASKRGLDDAAIILREVAQG